MLVVVPLPVCLTKIVANANGSPFSSVIVPLIPPANTIVEQLNTNDIVSIRNRKAKNERDDTNMKMKCLTKIKSLSAYHFFDRVRHEITHRLIISDAVPDKGRGNVQQRGLY